MDLIDEGLDTPFYTAYLSNKDTNNLSFVESAFSIENLDALFDELRREHDNGFK